MDQADRVKMSMFVLVIILSLALVQCGSSTVETVLFKTSPSPAIVIESDYITSYTNASGTVVKEVYKGPWTFWNFEATNVTSSTITIFAIKLESTGQVKFKTDISAVNFLDGRTYLFQLGPKGQKDTDPTDTFKGRVVIAELPTREQVRSLNYFLYAKAIGWYGDYANPTKSFKTSFSFRASE